MSSNPDYWGMTVTFRSGWIPTPPERPRVRFTAALREIAAPSSADYFSAVTTIGMHLNDQLGCCTCSALANIVQQQSQYGQGTEVVVPDSDVLAAYEAVGHYNPNDGPPGNNPTDQGAQVPDALGYLKVTGMQGVKVAAYGDIDVTNTEKIKVAIAEFGCVDAGVNLPNSAMTQFNAGPAEGESCPVWDVVANDGGIDGGHSVLLCGYNDKGFFLWSWGQLVLCTNAWWAKYGGEAWAAVSQEWLNAASGNDPEGVDKEVLGAEFLSVTGQNPFPA